MLIIGLSYQLQSEHPYSLSPSLPYARPVWTLALDRPVGHMCHYQCEQSVGEVWNTSELSPPIKSPITGMRNESRKKEKLCLQREAATIRNILDVINEKGEERKHLSGTKTIFWCRSSNSLTALSRFTNCCMGWSLQRTSIAHSTPVNIKSESVRECFTITMAQFNAIIGVRWRTYHL